MEPRTKQLVSRAIVTLIFCGVGVAHFTEAERMVRNMPPYLPVKAELVAISGVFEILGGLGVWAPWQKLRRFTGYCLLALLVSVYIVNIDMALHGSPLRDGTVVPGGDLVLWLRLPMQFVMMWLVMVATKDLGTPDAAPATSEGGTPAA